MAYRTSPYQRVRPNGAGMGAGGWRDVAMRLSSMDEYRVDKNVPSPSLQFAVCRAESILFGPFADRQLSKTTFVKLPCPAAPACLHSCDYRMSQLGAG